MISFGGINVPISPYLLQSCGLERVSGTNNYGEDTFAASVSVSCRFEQQTTTFTNATGDTVESTARVFLLPSQAVGVGDRITYGGQVGQVMRVKEAYADNALHHKVAYLGYGGIGR